MSVGLILVLIYIFAVGIHSLNVLFSSEDVFASNQRFFYASLIIFSIILVLIGFFDIPNIHL